MQPLPEYVDPEAWAEYDALREESAEDSSHA